MSSANTAIGQSRDYKGPDGRCKKKTERSENGKTRRGGQDCRYHSRPGIKSELSEPAPYAEAAMNSQFEVTPFPVAPVEPPKEPEAGSETVLLLRQIVEIQREQLTLLRASAAAHDAGARWRAFLTRWREAFPDLAESCREAMLILERSYGALIAELVEHLRQDGSDGLDSDFALQEFLDRYGIRLAQLGTILNLVAPLAEATSQGESS
jgi:hypothetical protein